MLYIAFCPLTIYIRLQNDFIDLKIIFVACLYSVQMSINQNRTRFLFYLLSTKCLIPTFKFPAGGEAPLEPQ